MHSCLILANVIQTSNLIKYTSNPTSGNLPMSHSNSYLFAFCFSALEPFHCDAPRVRIDSTYDSRVNAAWKATEVMWGTAKYGQAQ